MDTATSPTEVITDIDPVESQSDLFDFEKCKTRHTRLISSWSEDIAVMESNRARRYPEVDPAILRETGEIAKDETLIPQLTIDKNINRDLPPYLNFLRNSRRIATFSNVNDRMQDTQELEEEFTRGMTYSGWESPFYRELDGSALHGYDFVELVFDVSKPLHVGIEHVGFTQLLFPRDSINIQTSEMLMRMYSLTRLQLDDFVREYGFDAEQVKQLLNPSKENPDQKNFIVYKRFCKYRGIVYVSWLAMSNGVTSWLKAPAKLFLGKQHEEQVTTPPNDPMMLAVMSMQPTPQAPIIPQVSMQMVDDDETSYPLFILPYRMTEDEKIVNLKGRAFLDYPTQEATTSIWTSVVNGNTRASGCYAYVEQSSDTSRVKTLDVTLQSNRVYDKPLGFFAPPYPSESLQFAAQALDVNNSATAGQINYAVANKKGARNTATEIESANDQQQMLTSVQLTLFSTHIREVYAAAWLIVQSRALLGKITFLSDGTRNRTELIMGTFEVRAAGDIDVVKRAEKEKKMQTFWPVVANTPAGPAFLQDMLMLAFPEDGNKYGKILEQANQDVMLIQSLLALLQGAMSPEEFSALDPMSKQQMLQIVQAASARVAGSNGQQVNPNQPQQQPQLAEVS